MRQELSEPRSVQVPPAASTHQGIDRANPHELSPGLYNQDLAPTTRKGRSWNAYSIFTLWANDVHSLGNYAFAIGLFALGMSAGQILGALAIGAILLFALLNFSGFMGEKTGVPFPVMSRIAFGITGAQIPALIRGAVAIAWFGIQTYLASQVLSVMVIAVAPGAASLQDSSFLGLNTLGWICFVALWAIQLVIVSYGMEMIRKYEAFAGPVILVTFLALAIWMFIESGFNISLSTGETKSGGAMWASMFGAAALWVSIYGTFVLNFCDFTRGAKSKKSIVKGNFFGIPLNMLFFGAIVVVLTGTQFSINGKIITSPSDVVSAIPNTFLLLLASAALLVLTIAVNLMANFVAPTYALTNLFPKKLNFRSAAMISGVIGLVILPWNLYNSPEIINYFLGGLGALLGPLFGIIMADYWLIRKARINVMDLYRANPEGTYYFTRGVSYRAVGALVISSVIALVLAFVPALHVVGSFAWFLGSGAGAVAYLVLAKRQHDLADIDGEPIAVAPTH
ncbi:NCS1 family nucleobase:cation symporter-1 [Glutamicibacter mishrai]|uniref:NCS1 family nucleobase:cation symporter-1 n=1 Tax=Glutamicibacter mishrai TaxID=1775880 RepID=A0A6H0SHP8_9MICC|nr:NCS1 family nucleobase:cation symporter-1 [Glutamicibacter mishrai]QIV86918.1 NCS1 family nucleobase:cation symporter-1 [Glutamicibacter mishrai]